MDWHSFYIHLLYANYFNGIHATHPHKIIQIRVRTSSYLTGAHNRCTTTHFRIQFVNEVQLLVVI